MTGMHPRVIDVFLQPRKCVLIEWKSMRQEGGRYFLHFIASGTNPQIRDLLFSGLSHSLPIVLIVWILRAIGTHTLAPQPTPCGARQKVAAAMRS